MVVFVHFNHFIDRKINFHTNPCNLAFRRLFSVILPPPPLLYVFPYTEKSFLQTLNGEKMNSKHGKNVIL